MQKILFKKLENCNLPYAIQYKDGVDKDDLSILESLINRKIPKEYEDFITDKLIRIHYDDFEEENLPISTNPIDHFIKSEYVGSGNFLSFLSPKEAEYHTTELKEWAEEDYENKRTSRLLKNAFVFMQGYGDANFYLFVVNDEDELVIMGFDGDGNGGLYEVSKDFEGFIDYYTHKYLLRHMK